VNEHPKNEKQELTQQLCDLDASIAEPKQKIADAYTQQVKLGYCNELILTFSI